MGDLATHGGVARKVIAVFTAADFLKRPGKPKLNYEYFELGNFLTDVSQLRDIYSWTNAKIAAWDAGLEDHWAFTLRIADMDDYLDELLGKSRVHGKLAQFLRELAFLIGCEKFVKHGKPSLPFKEYERIFRYLEGERLYKGYTQYWPHEHLDFPLFAYGNKIGYRQKSKVNRHSCDPKKAESGPSRKLYDALEQQISFCAELLTSAEHAFRQLACKKDSPLAQKERNNMLALLGHVSHVIEDFWFHSNFIDKAWSRIGKPLPGDENTDRWRRVWLRRLRMPKGTDHNTKLSTTDSDFDDLVITGSFGDKDVFYTLTDILKTQKKHLMGLPGIMGTALFGASTRQRLFERTADGKAYKNKDDREKFFKQLRDFVNNPDQHLATSRASGKALHPESEKAIKTMCAIDKKIYDRFSGTFGVPDDYCGPFAFMIELLAKADRETRASDNKAKEFDTIAVPVALEDMKSPAPTNAYYTKTILPTSNGCGREVIGSHSLLNKDNATKKPLFAQAFSIASHLSCYIAKLLIRQANQQRVAVARFHSQAQGPAKSVAVNTLGKAKYIDWLHLLQHFLCHPDECEDQWHVKMMEDENAPNHHVLQFIDEDAAKERMKLVRRDHLKELYKNLEVNAEAEWQKVKKR